MAKKLFVLGNYKTGSSTIVGMLNAHPDMFILYETQLYRSELSKYARQFVGKYPDARFLFNGFTAIPKLYDNLSGFLNEKGWNYRIVGDKLPFIDRYIFSELKDEYILFLVRDVRTWLVKKQITAIYLNGIDMVPIAVDYVFSLVYSELFRRCLKIKTEDVVIDASSVFSDIEIFLDVDMSPVRGRWVEAMMEVKDEPKLAQAWLKSHPSSKMDVRRMDTEVVLKKHRFWDELLPLFDSYYFGEGGDPLKDMERVKKIAEMGPVSPRELYSQVVWTDLQTGKQEIVEFS